VWVDMRVHMYSYHKEYKAQNQSKPVWALGLNLAWSLYFQEILPERRTRVLLHTCSLKCLFQIEYTECNWRMYLCIYIPVSWFNCAGSLPGKRL
jgi:hypothetical protein